MNCISEQAKIGTDTELGAFCVIEADAVIGDGCKIGHHVVIHAGSVIGSHVRIDDFAVVGKQPMIAANSAVTREKEMPPAKIGAGSIIGANAVLYRGCEIGEDVLVADMATVREDVRIGSKTIIGRGAAIENRCTVGVCCKIETNAYITAYSVIEDHCFVAPCVVTSNDNYAGRSKKRFGSFRGLTLRRGGRIGAGCVVLPGKTVQEDAFVAAGSLVTRDVPARKAAKGSPAQVFRDVEEDQLLENQ